MRDFAVTEKGAASARLVLATVVLALACGAKGPSRPYGSAAKGTGAAVI